MKEAFIIMQIGNHDLDAVCRDAIVPALKSCNLKPKRVDKHNEGGLLKSKIDEFINSSDIIVADLTNERPNCYLEVGYAMGKNKFQNLILTAREDHHQDSPNYKSGGPKIHFDLNGYDILLWTPDDLPAFRAKLEKCVKQRLRTIVSEGASLASPWDEQWISTHKDVAMAGLKKAGKEGFMEIRMTTHDTNFAFQQNELLRVAEQAQIRTSGWPIGVVFHSDTEFSPKAMSDGIVAEITTKDNFSYDYWTIRRDGTFYLLQSLSEEPDIQIFPPKRIDFDIMIVRATETLLYAERLYSGFKVPFDSRVLVKIRYGGLKDRILTSADVRMRLRGGYKSHADEIYTEVETSIDEIEPNIVKLVHELTQPLFVVFNYYAVDEGALKDIVENFVAGRVT